MSNARTWKEFYVILRKFAFLCNCKETLSVLEHSVEILVGLKEVGKNFGQNQNSRPKF